MVVNLMADALAGSADAFADDDDPELIQAALPFALKTVEALLREAPEDRDLLLSAASGYVQYAWAFVQDEADRIDATDRARARVLRARAQRLYLRGRNYAFRGLEVAHPGFTAELARASETALARAGRDDVPFLYWAGASWAGAFTASASDLELLADLPTAAACMERVLQLDEGYSRGAAHEFFVSYHGARPEAMGGGAGKAREHYQRALTLSGGLRGSLHLALAETVAVREQDLASFRRLLELALAVDPDRDPALRLANHIARRRAEWLKTRIPDLFVEGTGEEAEKR
jgi:predicted anti-sigma-YlaC factor YlaD